MPMLEITTQIGCPLMCKFCPQDKIIHAYQSAERVMSMQTFTTCLDKLPKDVTISFAGYNEPWTNKNCTDFVEYTVNRGHNILLFTTLHGMTNNDVDRMAELITKNQKQFNQIYIHLPDAQGNMIGWKSTTEYQYAVDRFKQLPKANFMVMDQNKKVHQEVKINTQPIYWEMYSRAGNLDESKVVGQLLRETPHYEFVVECSRNKELDANVLLPNGDVTLCCMDYGLKHVLGNLINESYEDLRNSKELARVRELNNQLGFSDQVLCKSCDSGYCRTPWNDDEVKERVIKEAPHILNP